MFRFDGNTYGCYGENAIRNSINPLIQIIMFDPKYPEYGVVRIQNGDVKLYDSQFSFRTITVGNAVSAIWAGNCLNVTLSDGHVRRYNDFYTFIRI